MRKFYRIDKRRIICADSKKAANRNMILNLINSGVRVQYVDRDTGEDLMPIIMRLGSNKIQKENDDSDLGPTTPLYKAKLNNCKRCKALTVNRFNCSTCLDKIQTRIDEDYIFFTSSSSSDIDGEV